MSLTARRSAGIVTADERYWIRGQDSGLPKFGHAES